MSTSPDRKVSNMTGDAALPRKNGELVFEAPWEGRAFGLAVAMNEGGLYEWGDFRDRLVESIAADESRGGQAGYYERWMKALEQLALDRGFVTPAELDVRTEEYESGERDDD